MSIGTMADFSVRAIGRSWPHESLALLQHPLAFSLASVEVAYPLHSALQAFTQKPQEQSNQLHCQMLLQMTRPEPSAKMVD